MRAVAVGLLVSLITSAVVVGLHAWFPSRAFVFLYLPMVAMLAYRAGRAPGLVGSAASIAGAWYVLIGPARTNPLTAGMVVFVALFAASAVGLEEAMSRARAGALASRGLAAIVGSSEDAIFSKTLDGTILTWNAGAERMYGYVRTEAIGRSVAMLAPPEQRDEIPGILARLARDEAVEHYESVRMKKDGTRFDVSLTISPVRDETGRITGASTITRDITGRKRIERQQRFLIEAADLFAAALSVRGLLEAFAALVVPALADWCSIDLLDESGEPRSVTVVHRDPAKAALARRLQERLAEDPRARAARMRVITTGKPELYAEIPDVLLEQSVTDAGMLEEIRGLGLRSSMTVPLVARGRVIGSIGLIAAESGRRYTEEDLAFAEQLAHHAALAADNARLHEAEAEARKTAEQTAGRIGRLQAFTAALSEALTPEQVADITVRHAAEELGAGAGAVCLRADDAERLTLAAVAGYSPEVTDRWRREPDQIAPLAEAIRTGRVVWYSSWAEFQARYPEVVAPAEPVREGARAAVPLVLHERAIGALYVNFAGDRRFGPEDLEFMLTLGRQCAQAVERARLYAREHQVATTLQRALLPGAVPDLPGVRLDAAYLAATRAADVGGDWYDAFRLPDGRLCVAIGDVVGHGLQAAVVMGQMRQVIRTAALEGHEPAAVLALANHLLRLNQREGMTTAIVGMLDPLAMTFTYAAAGHPGPIMAAGGRIETLASGGLPLGFLEGTTAPSWTVRLVPGAFLVLYTDGLIEFSRDASAGHAALLAAIDQEYARQSPDPAQRLLHRVLGGEHAADDIAVVVLAVDAEPLNRLDLTLPAEPSSLRLVRQAIQQLCAGIGLDERRAFDLNVAVGEAVNNVVEHAYGVTSGSLRVRALREDSSLLIEIQDAGRWRPDRPDNPGGRGFNLMRALTDGVHVVTGEHGTVVRLTVGLGAGAPPAAARTAAPGQGALAPLIEVHESGPRGGDSGARADGHRARRTIEGVRFDVRTHGTTPVVAPAGDIDLASISRLVETLEDVAARAERLVVLALGEVSYFDSQGVRALLRVHQRLAAGRRTLAVVVPPGSPVRRLIEVAGLRAALPIFDTIENVVARGA